MKTKKARFVLVNIEEPKQVLYTEEEVRKIILKCCEDITYPETYYEPCNDDEENEQEKKRGLFTRVLAVLIAIVSVVFFLVTEDLSLPWTWTDQWTIWMVVIGFVQIVVFFVGRKWKNVDNDDEDEQTQQA